jgi:outer membrane protein OmpA-like peptidoglycan-associated protein
VVIRYKGEKEPVDQNKTDEGKQRNRRVDFKFI